MPSNAQIHVDAALTDFSVAYMQDAAGYVARQAFPQTNVARQSDKYYIYSKADFFRTEAQKRGPNTESASRTYALSTDQYFADVYALHYDVSEQERANADPVLDPEEDAAALLMQDLMIKEDQEWAATAFTTSVWGTDVTGGTNFVQFDDAASTPIETLRVGHTTILGETGKRPDKLVLGHETWAEGLVDHPDILDRIKHSQTGVVTEDLLANILGLDQVIVGYSIRNTADEGATESDSFQLGKHALLIHSPSNAGPRTPVAGRTFAWSGLLGGTAGIRTKRYDLPEVDAYPRIETDMAFDHKVVGTSLGYFLSGAVA